MSGDHEQASASSAPPLQLHQCYEALVNHASKEHSRHFKEAYETLQLRGTQDARAFLDIVRDDTLGFLNRLPPKNKSLHALKKPRYAISAFLDLQVAVDALGSEYCDAVKYALKTCFDKHARAISEARSGGTRAAGKNADARQQPRQHDGEDVDNDDGSGGGDNETEDDEGSDDTSPRKTDAAAGQKQAAILREKDAVIAVLRRENDALRSANTKLISLVEMLLEVTPEQSSPYTRILKAVPGWIVPK